MWEKAIFRLDGSKASLSASALDDAVCQVCVRWQ
jgi:hypothetical protein